jgi:hypothetical protein
MRALRQMHEIGDYGPRLFKVQYLKKAGGPPAAQMVLAAWAMVGRLAAVVIIRVLMTSSGVVAAAAKAPEMAPITKSSCEGKYYAFTKGMDELSEACYLPGEVTVSL